MNNRTSVFTSLLLVLAIGLLPLASGCSSFGSAYQLKQTRNDVDWAMTRYRNRLASGFITPAEQQRVNAAYLSYQKAFDDAAKAANSNFDTPTPSNVKTRADELLSLLNSLP